MISKSKQEYLMKIAPPFIRISADRALRGDRPTPTRFCASRRALSNAASPIITPPACVLSLMNRPLPVGPLVRDLASAESPSSPSSASRHEIGGVEEGFVDCKR